MLSTSTIGWYQWAWQYLQKNGGAELEKDYKYVSGRTTRVGTCTFSKEKVVAQVKGYHDLARGDENQLKEALATVGPVSVAIDAGRSGFRSYKSGDCLFLFCSNSDVQDLNNYQSRRRQTYSFSTYFSSNFLRFKSGF